MSVRDTHELMKYWRHTHTNGRVTNLLIHTVQHRRLTRSNLFLVEEGTHPSLFVEDSLDVVVEIGGHDAVEHEQ